MKPLLFMALAALLLSLSGCTHMEKVSENQKSSYTAYVGQPAGSITITGLTSLTLAMPLTPLEAQAPARGIMGELKDLAVGVAPYAAGMYIGGKALDNAGGGTKVVSEAPAAP